jgi:hypothetical protein
MPTTIGRKKRRELMRKQREDIECFVEAYSRDPGLALKSAFEQFGRQKFEGMLRRYVVSHSIGLSLRLAMSKCMEENNGHVSSSKTIING